MSGGPGSGSTRELAEEIPEQFEPPPPLVRVVIADGSLRRRQIGQIGRRFEGGALVPLVERIDVGQEEPAPGIR